MSNSSEHKSDELVRINALVEAYEKAHESRHRQLGEPSQRAFLYSSDPSGWGDDNRRKYIFGQCQVVGIDRALALIKQIAFEYGIDFREK